MDMIIKNYGEAILAVVATLTLCLVITGIIGSDETSNVFQTLVDNFYTNAQAYIPGPTP